MFFRSTKEASARPDNLALTAIENTATIKDTRASSVSQPIPVPSQIHNYEKMQESKDRTKGLGGAPPGSPSGSPFDGRYHKLSGYFFNWNYSDRRASIDRLRQASIASSNSDLANSISPPAVRFTTDGAVATANPFSLVAATRRLSNFKLNERNIFRGYFSNNTTAISSNSTIGIQFKSSSTTEFQISDRYFTIEITTKNNGY